MSGKSDRVLCLCGKPFIWLTLRLTFGDKMNLTAADGINRAVNTAVMIVQGDQDDFVGFDGPCIYANRDKITRTDVKYVLLEGREHGDLMMDYSEERLAYMENWMRSIKRCSSSTRMRFQMKFSKRGMTRLTKS